MGAVRLGDIASGPTSGIYPSAANFIPMGGALYFVSGFALWKTDGTEEVTVRVKEFPAISSGLVVADGVLYFTGSLGSFLVGS